MSINVSQSFHRTSANAVDDTMTLTKAQMLAINDNLMPSKYFTICQEDGAIYLYDKSATPNVETGKFTKFEGGSGSTVDYSTNVTNKPKLNNTEINGSKTSSDFGLQNSLLSNAISIDGINRTTVEAALTALGAKVKPKAFTDFGSGTINSTNYVAVGNSTLMYAKWNAGGSYGTNPGFPMPLGWGYPQADIFYIVLMVRDADDTYIDYVCYAFFTYGKTYVKQYGRRATKSNNTWTYPDWKEIGGDSLPTGGTTGQVLSKKSNTDGDVEWKTPTSYTAGDGIDITNNVISTDKMPSSDMAEIVTPLPSVMSRRMKYSTDEQIVGEWIDGKPLYQKTKRFTAPSNTGAIVIDTITNLGEVVDLKGIIVNETSTQQIPLPWLYNINDDMCGIFTQGTSIYCMARGSNYFGRNGFFTIQYTKTTD